MRAATLKTMGGPAPSPVSSPDGVAADESSEDLFEAGQAVRVERRTKQIGSTFFIA